MNQTLLETRQKAEALLKQALSIWRQSDQSESLDGIEQDPIFMLLFTAVAYQNNDIEMDIERLKDEVELEFAQHLTPREMSHPTPATAVITTALDDDTAKLDVDSHLQFKLEDSPYCFVPVLKTRMLNAKIQQMQRIDGHQWEVTLTFNEPIHDLSGFSFAISEASGMCNLNIYCNGKQLPLIRPTDYGNMPYAHGFNLESMLFGASQTYCNPNLSMDLLAREYTAIYVFDEGAVVQSQQSEALSIKLTFVFEKISKSFSFTPDNLHLNCLVLANVQISTATLSADNPIARISGTEISQGGAMTTSSQFLQLVPQPGLHQYYGKDAPFRLRRVAGDRYTQASLLKHLYSLNNKLHSDFYAFQQLHNIDVNRAFRHLQTILHELIVATTESSETPVGGTYLMLGQEQIRKRMSLDVEYMLTQGSRPNNLLQQESKFSVPAGLVKEKTRQIAKPVPGFDEMRHGLTDKTLARYYITTNDRIVTPADIKIFCYTYLLLLFGVEREMIRSIHVTTRPDLNDSQCGYRIEVNIVLANRLYIHRNFEDRIPMAQHLMSRMMEVRSTNVYPIVVSMTIENS